MSLGFLIFAYMTNTEITSFFLAYAHSSCAIELPDGTRSTISADLVLDLTQSELKSSKLLLKSQDTIGLNDATEFIRDEVGEEVLKELASNEIIDYATKIMFKGTTPIDFLRERGYATKYKGRDMVARGYVTLR